MLERLYVENFAIIEKVEIKFLDNLTVLTGQTGAGKSLVLDTIALLLGDRSDTDMIRYGKDKAIIDADFSYTNKKIDELLKQLNIPIKDKLNIKREITLNKKNSIRVNGVLVSLIDLKLLAKNLADIHIQHDTIKLLDQENYIKLISVADDKYNQALESYQSSLYTYLEAYHVYKKILSTSKNNLEKLDFYKYSYEELTKLKLIKNEDEELEGSINKLENFDKIYQALNKSYEVLDSEMSPVSLIYEMKELLNKITSYDEEYSNYKERLENIYYELEDLKSNIYSNIESFDFDPQELEFMIERLEKINFVKKKYNKSLEQLLDYINELKLNIDLAENYDATIENAFLDLQKEYKNLCDHAIILSNIRKKNASNLESNLIKECLDLGIENISFQISFHEIILNDCLDKEKFKEDGIDSVDFLVSMNKGEPLKSLAKVGSGGELSRIMLAFKTIMAKSNHYSLMVFDEIDTGVSGATASLIASKMKEIASITQVLVISHLPQVAASANHHINIYKKEENNLTYTNVEYLDYKSRIKNIAIMLSGKNISNLAISTAEMMLNENEIYK